MSIRGLGHQALFTLPDVPGRQGRAQGAAGVPRRGLDPDVFEGAPADQLAVGHAVQGHAAGHHQVVGPGELLGGLRQAQHDLFRGLLDGQGQVHVPLVQQGLPGPARHPEQGFPLVVPAHGEAGGEVEIIHVEQQRPVFPEVHQFVQDQGLKALAPARPRGCRRGPAP